MLSGKLAFTDQYGIQSMVNMAEFGICPQVQSSKKVLLSSLPFSQLSLYQPYVVQHLNVAWDKTTASENGLGVC